MPAIDVHKYKGTIIPVSESKSARAYQCPWTKELYATKRGYVNHLRQLRSERMHWRAKHIRFHKLGENLWNQNSFENIRTWIEMHPEWFLDRVFMNSSSNNQSAYDSIRPHFWFKLTFLDVTWSANVSNSHECPHNGLTNWGGREPDRPTGYPGWTGRIEYQTSHELLGFHSNIMDGTRIHTGTGGSIAKGRYGYSVKFFEDDWPGLCNIRVWNTLKDQHNHSACFGSPAYFR